jgi:hypothetical protein
MRTLKTLYIFIFALAWMLIVPILFKSIPDRKLAASLAGAGFVLIPLIFLWTVYLIKMSSTSEAVHLNKKHLGLSITNWSVFLTMQFWILFAIPIFFSRVIYWDEDFQSFQFFGLFSAELWHRLSSKSYLIMVIGMGLFEYFSRKTNGKRPSLH